jgi:hypothetical protein
MNYHPARLFKQRKLSTLVVFGLMTAFASTAGAQTVKDAYSDYEGGPAFVTNAEDIPGAGGAGSGSSAGAAVPGVTRASGIVVGQSFQGVTQYNLTALLGGSFIPPDTMGAIGATQFMETTNGVYAIYDKTTGALQSMVRGDAFWNAAGGAGFKNLNGDARVMFDQTSQKWIAISFGNSLSDIQIAVSTTSNALGPWQATKFTGNVGGIADYPTLAIDKDAIYIGTNNFSAAGSFQGTTLNVIARSDLLGAGAPTTTSLKQFTTPYPGTFTDGGFAIQGVNSTTSSGMAMAASLFYNDSIRYDISNPGTAGATKGATTYLGLTDYGNTLGGRQPDGTRNIDAFDQRISSSVWEHDGKIYAVYGATPVGGTNNEVRWVITDALTNAVIQEGFIGDPNYDYYQPSLSINSAGQVVIGYNRSGFGPDGKVTFMATTFNSNADGTLYKTDDIVLHVSSVGDYHNGSPEGAAAAGRQRWGDYSAVTIDPNDDKSFWVIGEYAAEWNNAAGGHPGGSGGSRWGTWISEIDLSGQVPEPGSLALLGAGLLALGAVKRRKNATKA